LKDRRNLLLQATVFHNNDFAEEIERSVKKAYAEAASGFNDLEQNIGGFDVWGNINYPALLSYFSTWTEAANATPKSAVNVLTNRISGLIGGWLFKSFAKTRSINKGLIALAAATDSQFVPFTISG
jgi:hypothetical protein